MTDPIRFTDAQLEGIDQSLDQLEQAFVALVGLDPMTRRRLFKMGDKSEAFCRQALTLLDQNRQVVPPSMGLDEALDDLRTLDRLRPRAKRMQRLVERMADSEMALGAEVAQASRKGYALLKVAGKNQGLEALRGELSGRFKGRRPRSAQARMEVDKSGGEAA